MSPPAPGGCSQPRGIGELWGLLRAPPPAPFIAQNWGVNKEGKDDTNIGNLLQTRTCACTQGALASGRGCLSPPPSTGGVPVLPRAPPGVPSALKSKTLCIFQGALAQQPLLQTSFRG